MEELKDTLTNRLDEMRAACTQKENKLKEDSRDDEALFEKIKGNIVEIFITVLDVSYSQSKAAGGGKDMLIQKFSAFFDKIPATWKASLEDAKEDNDFETVHKEKLKIAMADKIQAEFERIASSQGGGSV